jgi:trans-2,3-dihydro-3-hydroxyanthranilate isomerase
MTAPRAGRFRNHRKMRLQFETVDVFTSDQFSGNPLAVVLNAEGLSTEQMQAIAGEFNLVETTFVLPPKDSAHTAEVRIFTPRAEMPFAGHPNIGTAFVLARAGTSYGRAIPVTESAGAVQRAHQALSNTGSPHSRG